MKKVGFNKGRAQFILGSKLKWNNPVSLPKEENTVG